MELAAAKAQAEQAGKTTYPSSRSSLKDQAGGDSGLRENTTKISLPGRMGNRSVKLVTGSPPASNGDDGGGHRAAATTEEVKLDHLSSMLASGKLQQAWGAATTPGSDN